MEGASHVPPDGTPRRAALDATGQQAGDQTFGNVAGGDINDPGPWLEFMRGYLHDLDQRRTRRDDELAHELKEARAAVEHLQAMFSAYQRFVSDRFAADATRRATDRLIAVAALLVAVAALGIALLV